MGDVVGVPIGAEDGLLVVGDIVGLFEARGVGSLVGDFVVGWEVGLEVVGCVVGFGVAGVVRSV